MKKLLAILFCLIFSQPCWAGIPGADYHPTAASPTIGTLPVNCGGTGGTTGTAAINNLITGTPSSGNAVIYNGTNWVPRAINTAPNCRITLTSGVPVTTGDVTAATTFYIDPYLGTTVWLPDTTGNNFQPFDLSEISTAVPGGPYQLFDVFLYNNSGSPAVTTIAWDSGGRVSGLITGATAANPCVLTTSNSLSAGQYIGITGIGGTIGSTASNGLNGKVFRVSSANSTSITLEPGINTSGLSYTSSGYWYVIPSTRTTSLTFQNGVYLSTGNLNYLYIGTMLAGAAGTAAQTNDASASRLVWNYFNRVPKLSAFDDPSVDWTYSTTTWHPRNNNTAIGAGRAETVVGIVDKPIVEQNFVQVANTSAAQTMYTAVEPNYVEYGGLFQAGVNSQAANTPITLFAQTYIYPSLGYSFYQAVEYGGASGTSTFYGAGYSTGLGCNLTTDQ